MSKNDTFIILAIALIVVLSVGITRLNSTRGEFSVYVGEDAFNANIPYGERGEEYQFMASKNGTKYYPKGCKAGNRIKDKNRVYFDLETDAQRSGYEPAKNC